MTRLRKTRIIVDPRSSAACADISCPANNRRMGTFGSCLAHCRKPFPQRCQKVPVEARKWVVP